MLQTLGDIKTEVLVRMNASTTAAYYTDTILNQWIDLGHRWAASYKKWPFTFYLDQSIPFVSGTEVYTYPSNFKTGSIRYIQDASSAANPPIYQKVEFKSYQNYRTTNTSGQDKIFADLGRTFYINPNIATGTLQCYGIILPASLGGDPAAVTTFSNADEDGNEAIVEFVMSYAKNREKKRSESDDHVKAAKAILDNLWTAMIEEKGNAQIKDTPMFKRFNVERGVLSEDLLKRDQFY